VPELPDILLYQTRLRERIVGQPLESLRFFNPFVLRSVRPSVPELVGRTMTDVTRLGKRLVLEFEEEFFVVIHLMIAGRLGWQSPLPEAKPSLGKIVIAAWRFPSGQLSLIETTTKKRASVNLVHGRSDLNSLRRSGLDVLNAATIDLLTVIRSQHRTLKRVLTDRDLLDGIGNAYSDEILLHAKLSPVKLATSLSDEDANRLVSAARSTLETWTERLQAEIRGFPKPAQITAFRPDFAVHGRFGLPCPVCGSPIQRIVRGDHETNYCATCQTGGKLLADHSLSRLLKSDWPSTLEEMLSA
jgi:formamidopyrimidine-DNA glycosylase